MNSSGMHVNVAIGSDLGFYLFLDRHLIRRSYTGKLFLFCFLGTHLPLLAFVGMRLVAQPDGRAWQDLLVLLPATLAGTGLALLAMHLLLAPLRVARDGLRRFAETRQLPNLPRHLEDEAGQLLAGVDVTLRELDAAMEELSRQGTSDPLTGLGNRRRAELLLVQKTAEARRYGNLLSVILLDVDDIGRLRQAEGHAAADAALRLVAETIRAATRESDILARIGGETFCLVLENVAAGDVVRVAERLRERIERMEIPDHPRVHVTASIGVAPIPVNAASLTALTARAEACLQVARRQGRNRIVAEPVPART